MSLSPCCYSFAKSDHNHHWTIRHQATALQKVHSLLFRLKYKAPLDHISRIQDAATMFHSGGSITLGIFPHTSFRSPTSPTDIVSASRCHHRRCTTKNQRHQTPKRQLHRNPARALESLPQRLDREI